MLSCFERLCSALKVSAGLTSWLSLPLLPSYSEGIVVFVDLKSIWLNSIDYYVIFSHDTIMIIYWFNNASFSSSELMDYFPSHVYSCFGVCVTTVRDVWVTCTSLCLMQERTDVFLTTAAVGTFVTFVSVEQAMIWGPPLLNPRTSLHSRCLSVKRSRQRRHIWPEKCVCVCILGCMTVSDCSWAEVRGRRLHLLSHPLRGKSLLDWLRLFVSTTAKHHG